MRKLEGFIIRKKYLFNKTEWTRFSFRVNKKIGGGGKIGFKYCVTAKKYNFLIYNKIDVF